MDVRRLGWRLLRARFVHDRCHPASRGQRDVSPRRSSPRNVDAHTHTPRSTEPRRSCLLWNGSRRDSCRVLSPDPCAVATCTFSVPTNGRVVLEAASGDLLRWEGSCIGNARRCIVVAAGSETVTANFRAGLPSDLFYGVNVTRSGAGHVTSVPPGIDCGPSSSCRATFDLDAAVQLSATPSPGSVFDRWSGDCGGAGTCTLRADTARAAVAVFKLIRHRVAVSLSGRGEGAVSSDPQGIACPPDCAFSFPQSTLVELSAKPSPGSVFDRWSGDCVGAGTCTLRADTEHQAVAVFEPIGHRVVVRLSGRGAGAVTSDPRGIACPPDCAFSFPQSTMVELRAKSSPGSRFAGWEDGCTGRDACRFNVERQVDAGARFEVCAASQFKRFSVTVAKRSRRLTVRFQLTAQAGVRVLLLRGGRTRAERTFGQRRAGVHLLHIRVPELAPGGRYRVQTRVSDLCGTTKRLSLPLRLARP